MTSILLARDFDAFGQILAPITLAEWFETARRFGIQIVNKVSVCNPYTAEVVETPQAGAGEWISRTGTHAVRFRCGALVFENCDEEDRARIEPIAAALGAHVLEAGIFFTCERLSLGEAMRRAASGLPRESDVFTSGSELAAGTPAILLILGSDDLPPAHVAAALGYPHALLPVDSLEQVAQSALQLSPAPSCDLLVRALTHYLEHDAFLDRC